MLKDQRLSELFVHVETQTGIIEVITLFIKLMENSGVKKTKRQRKSSLRVCAGVRAWVGHPQHAVNVSIEIDNDYLNLGNK